MKLFKYTLFTAIILIAVSCSSTDENTASWKISDNPLLTEWAGKVDPSSPWPEYPRPGMVREEWMNLNGLWDYSITAINERPDSFPGKILVPYPVESALSGVKERINEEQLLWYRKTIRIPSKWSKKRILLNFEASDWETTVEIDGKPAGSHRGGYDPFSFDITELVKDRGEHEILISVWDPTDHGNQPRGKQVSDPHGIWYTPSSGLWQTVWIEPVEESRINSFRIYTDIEKGEVRIDPELSGNTEDLTLTFMIAGEEGSVSAIKMKAGNNIVMRVPDFKLWSPESPYLYDCELILSENDVIKDRISTYFGFREVSLDVDNDGFTKIFLNGDFLFQNGPLDQGFWPDGLYTPPSDEAMKYDIEMTRKMGFNMLRKHVKIENRRFYYWCDKLGILVWQDMPSGDSYIGGSDPDIEKSSDDTKQFEFELTRLIETKFNHPSIIIWVPFNEGWGQFETGRISDFIKEKDPTRLVNSASGWTDRGTGDIMDIHHYPDPRSPEPEPSRAIVLGEFGGLGLPVQDHTWEQKNWGYQNMIDSDELLSKFRHYYDTIYRFVLTKGLSAVVYTQTTDVETETNGLLTYDRKVDKMGSGNVREANRGSLPPG